MPAKVPITAIGSASDGMIVAEAATQEQEDHADDERTRRSAATFCTSSIDERIVTLRS
jgi:hypothetical protein